MSAKEVSFNKLAGVPLHYDRKPPNGYGTAGTPQTFASTRRLQTGLEKSFAELFATWSLGKPDAILTAGTIGDGENAHGKGLAFDLDGFVYGKKVFRMDSYPRNRKLYVAINAHLLLHFPQVLSYHYPNHADHFHVDFNFTRVFRPASNAQMFFVQSAIRYVAGIDLGKGGPENDGVDGIWGQGTKAALAAALVKLGMPGANLASAGSWAAFLTEVRKRGFAGVTTFTA